MQTAEDFNIDFSGHEALQNALAYVEDFFGADLPDAPGMTFVGARFSAGKAAGMEAGPENRLALDESAFFSAGAADIDPMRCVFRCLGEVAETLSQFSRFRPDAPKLLPARAADADAAGRFSQTHGAGIAGAGWIRCREMLSGSEALVPAAVCYRDLCAPAAPAAAFSTGCAAGQTLADAVHAATLELIERDAVASWWFGGAPARLLDADAVPGLSGIVSAMRAGRSERRLIFLDLTTEFAIPVVAAVSADSEGRNIAFGFAARLELGDAASAAVCELAQMEFANLLASAKRQRGLPLAGSEAALLDRCRDLSLQDGLFQEGNAQTDERKDRFRGAEREQPMAATDLDAVLAANGIERFVVELTSPHLIVPVAKVVCPGLQTIPVTFQTERLKATLEKFGPRTGGAAMYRPI